MSRYLFDALERRSGMVARIDAQLHGWQRVLVALAAYHPARSRWKERFYKHPVAFALQSRNSRVALARIAQPYDVVVQVYALFQTLGAPYVLYLDNTHHLTRAAWPPASPFNALQAERWYALERRTYQEAQHIFTVGKAVAESLVTFYDVPAERVTVVHGGVNFATLPTLTSEPRDPVILFVGREYHRKGGDRLIEAFRGVRERLPHARLVVVGTREAPAEPGVEVLGTINDRARLAQVYAEASVFCLPSRFEPYGFSLSEAMAYGLPCVSTPVGALPEVVAQGQTGLLVPPDDSRSLTAALLRLLDDPAYATRLGMAGRRRVERYLNWDRVVDRMAPVLDGLVEIGRTESRRRVGGAALHVSIHG